jgi:hypothetical protein
MGAMDKSSPLIDAGGPMGLLPPQPAQKKGAPANAQDFREMLATQGVSAPKGGVPTGAEAQIEAAQIAGKANVAMGVKRGPVLSGMQQPQSPTVVAPAGERFLPLRQGPSAARIYNGLPQAPMASSVDELRATTKFATGRTPSAALKTSPVLTRTTPRGSDPALEQAGEQAAAQIAGTTAAPKAVEAYNYGLRAASENTMGEKKQNLVPSWFDSAVEKGLDKYNALNSTDKKP